jgi:hypothetical protein
MPGPSKPDNPQRRVVVDSLLMSTKYCFSDGMISAETLKARFTQIH